MEEKKLTDEEIVKALEFCVKNDCEKCPYLIKGFDCVISKQAENDFLDLIHRLQEQVNEYERKIAYGELVSKDWHDEQVLHDKAEIERLTEKVENQKVVIKGQNKAIEKEKSENKRLYDEYVRLDDFCAGKGCLCCICECKETCNECAKCGSLKTEKCKGFRIDVSKYARAIERADKLQKQVDELKEELEKAYDIERATIQAEIAEAGTSCHWCKAKTEKDTAKEIIKWIKRNGILEYGGYVIHDSTIEQMCKKYGVEVE